MDSFVAWIEGRVSEKNARKWERWVDNDPARKKLVEQARLLHKTFGFRASERPEASRELVRLKEVLAEREESDDSTKIYQLNRKTAYSSVAAIILLLVIALSVVGIVNPEFYQLEGEKTEQVFARSSTDNGEKKVLTLSDGSKITLNANSSLRYPAHYTDGDLKVWLEGEAYFDVTHKTGDEARTLSVLVPGGRIQVLGTEFNVNTFQEVTEVVLVQGRVNVEIKDSLDQVADSHIMEPGELSKMSMQQGRINTQRVNSEIYTSWTKDKLVFDEASLTSVTKRIEHLYGVRFQIDDQQLKGKTISGSLPNDNLEVFLNALENILERPVINKNGTIILGSSEPGTSNDS